MVGVIQFVLTRDSEALGFSRFELGAVLAVVFSQPHFFCTEPKVVESCSPASFSGIAKGVEIVLAFLPPVLELDAQLEGTAGEFYEIRFWNLQETVDR